MPKVLYIAAALKNILIIDACADAETYYSIQNVMKNFDLHQ